jgi:hypothetical protein
MPEINTYNVRDYTVEFPTTVNGHIASSTGFIIPKGNGRSQFFTVHDRGARVPVTYDWPEAVPQYLKHYIERKLARNNRCEIVNCSAHANWWLRSQIDGGNLLACTQHIVRAKRKLKSSPTQPVTLKEQVTLAGVEVWH